MIDLGSMIDLVSKQAKLCYTAAGQVFHDGTLLLVKHRKLGVWLAPGGHLDPEELPHLGAEREVFEETGIRARAIDPHPLLPSTSSQYLPSPILTNLHWVSEENYRRRMEAGDDYVVDPAWGKPCEQHLGFLYLMEVVEHTPLERNERESSDIGWFARDEVDTLETTDDLRREFHYGFDLITQLQSMPAQD